MIRKHHSDDKVPRILIDPPCCGIPIGNEPPSATAQGVDKKRGQNIAAVAVLLPQRRGSEEQFTKVLLNCKCSIRSDSIVPVGRVADSLMYEVDFHEGGYKILQSTVEQYQKVYGLKGSCWQSDPNVRLDRVREQIILTLTMPDLKGTIMSVSAIFTKMGFRITGAHGKREPISADEGGPGFRYRRHIWAVQEDVYGLIELMDSIRNLRNVRITSSSTV